MGWRPLLAVSWAVYIWYRIHPHAMTTGRFESVFPILAWQLLFIHGIVIGYHRQSLTAFVARVPRMVPRVGMLLAAGFCLFAFCNPWADGPTWLHWTVVSPERFTSFYERYFTLSDLGIGRLLNLAIGLPVLFALVTRFWALARPLEVLFVTLGQRSLGAFVLHVYGLLLLSLVPVAYGLWINTLLQVTMVVAIATLLSNARTLRQPQRHLSILHAEPLPA